MANFRYSTGRGFAKKAIIKQVMDFFLQTQYTGKKKRTCRDILFLDMGAAHGSNRFTVAAGQCPLVADRQRADSACLIS
jgi:hypothetical protein